VIPDGTGLFQLNRHSIKPTISGEPRKIYSLQEHI
jgi:hypothetical protein